MYSSELNLPFDVACDEALVLIITIVPTRALKWFTVRSKEGVLTNPVSHLLSPLWELIQVNTLSTVGFQLTAVKLRRRS